MGPFRNLQATQDWDSAAEGLQPVGNLCGEHMCQHDESGLNVEPFVGWPSWTQSLEWGVVHVVSLAKSQTEIPPAVMKELETV